MKRIYLDNASTSYPKAPGVAEAVAGFIGEVGMNINRGGYEAAFDAARIVLDARERICSLLGAHSPRNIIFTCNVTMSLNMLIKGLLREGDHVLVSSLEHNAMMRPLVQLQKRGVRFSRLPCSPDGQMDINAAERLICRETRAIFALHASNICGAITPARELGLLAEKHGLFYVLDIAQTAGFLDIDMKELRADALAFTGHKGLLGPQGVGGFAVTDALAAALEPLVSGGTGSFSDSEEVPAALPDRFEAGTMNLPGIYGLNAALIYLEKTGLDTIRQKERALAAKLDAALRAMPRVRVIGAEHASARTAIVSADFEGRDNAEIAFRLDEQYGIMTRCGLHCAPHAHRALGTFPQGTVRFSPGHFNTESEIEYAIDAVSRILAQ